MRRTCSSSQPGLSQKGEARLNSPTPHTVKFDFPFSKCCIVLIAISLIGLVPLVLAKDTLFTLDPAVLDAAEEKYGAAARARLLAWQALIQSENSQTDIAKLEKVNDFFNQFNQWNKSNQYNFYYSIVFYLIIASLPFLVSFDVVIM